MSSIALAQTPTRPCDGQAGRAGNRPAGRPDGGPGALRLTRRGRLVVFLTFLAAALGGLVFAVGGVATGSGERGAPVPVTTVQVESGDTLWSIATRAAPGEDPRDLIDEIEELNSLSGSLEVGTEIAVPVTD